MIIEFIEIREIRAFGSMRLFLKKMSLFRQLSKLYDNLLVQDSSNDPKNQKLANTVLKLFAVARRSFSILELA